MTATQERRDVLVIEGMFCAGCAASVEAVLARAPGVHAAAVNFAADAAVVAWRPDETNLETLTDAVRKLGYQARSVGDHGQESGNRDAAARDLGVRLAVAVFFGMWTMLPSFGLYLGASDDPQVMLGLAWAAGAFSLPVILYSGWPFYRMGWSTLRAGVPGMDALVATGVLGAFLLSAGLLISGSSEVYFEVGVALIALQLVARLLDLRVRREAQDAVTGLLELAPSRVTVIEADGREREAELKGLGTDVLLKVSPGDRLAIDGLVESGSANVDRSLLTGEASPARIGPGDAVHAGERVLDGALRVRVSAGAGKRRIDAIARQVRQMLAQKPPWQRLADTVARNFLWLAITAAFLGAGLALLSGDGILAATVRALAVFVIACPCALSLAAPMVSLVASSAAARRGVILRDLGALTHAATPDLVCFDKTGTLTLGSPRIETAHPCSGVSKAALLEAAATAERDSEHPIARAMRATSKPAAGGETRVVMGQGVEWRDDNRWIRVGRLDWIGATLPPDLTLPATTATRVFVAEGGGDEAKALGAIDLRDALRPGAADVIAALKAQGIESLLLSGDVEAAVHEVASALDISYQAACTPEDKVARIEAEKAAGRTVAFVGDGLNDGPALAAADLGIAVGSATDVARAAAAITLAESGVEVLPEVLVLTRRSRRLIYQNLAWAIVYNAVAIPSALVGWVHPTVAAIAMALSSITVVLNSLRARRTHGVRVKGQIGRSVPLL